MSSCTNTFKQDPVSVPATDGKALQASADGADAAEPAIASDANGRLYVVYVEHTGNDADVIFQRFDRTAQKAGEKVRVNPVAGTATAWKGDPPTLAVSGDGQKVYIGWTRRVTAEKGKGTDLMLSRSNDGGVTFSEPVKVNDDSAPASHGMHSLAVDRNGNVYFAWLDERNVKMPEHAEITGDTIFDPRTPAEGKYLKAHHTNSNTNSNSNAVSKPETDEEAEPNSEVFFSVSTDGGESFSANEKIASDVCPCCKTSMITDAAGKLYISWRQVLPVDLRHIAVASTADKGRSFSKPVIVSDDQWQLHACPVSGAAMSIEQNGALDVFWYTAGTAGTAGFYKAVSTDGGRSFSSREAVSDDSAAAGTPVAFNGTHECLFGEKDGRIRLSDGGKTIENAALASAVSVSSKIFVAFVRRSDDKRTVWIASMN